MTPLLKKGSTFTYDRRKQHVIDVVDDDGTLIYVLRYFGIYKQWWHYTAFKAEDLDNDIRAFPELYQNLKI